MVKVEAVTYVANPGRRMIEPGEIGVVSFRVKHLVFALFPRNKLLTRLRPGQFKIKEGKYEDIKEDF